ncbi:hypothetical protein J6590_067451 [Homalodisca vitripennis]|nr:hypothetical protein J6590_067451 [Homalodisca vitripennis]
MSYLALASSKVEMNRPVVTSCEVCSEYTETEYTSALKVHVRCTNVSSIRPIVTNNIIGNSDVLEQSVRNLEMQQIWGRNGELKSQLIALATPTDQQEPLPSFSLFAQNFSGYVPSFSQRQSTSTSESNVGGGSVLLKFPVWILFIRLRARIRAFTFQLTVSRFVSFMYFIQNEMGYIFKLDFAQQRSEQNPIRTVG